MPTSTFDRLTVYIDPTGVETSSGSTLTVLGEVGDGLDALKGTLQARLSGGFTGSREMFADDIAIGTTWNDVINPVVPRLSATVNPANGALSLVNNSSTAIDLAYYEVLSENGSLNVAGWSSLDDQNTSGGGWIENNPSANALRESNLTGSTTIAASGGTLTLGNAFAVGGTQDLLIRFGTKQGAQGLLQSGERRELRRRGWSGRAGTDELRALGAGRSSVWEIGGGASHERASHAGRGRLGLRR